MSEKYPKLTTSIESLKKMQITAQYNDEPILSALLIININRLEEHLKYITGGN